MYSLKKKDCGKEPPSLRKKEGRGVPDSTKKAHGVGIHRGPLSRASDMRQENLALTFAGRPNVDCLANSSIFSPPFPECETVDLDYFGLFRAVGVPVEQLYVPEHASSFGGSGTSSTLHLTPEPHP